MFDHTRLFISVFSNILCHYIFHADAFLHFFDIKLISKEVKFMGLIYSMIQIDFLFFFFKIASSCAWLVMLFSS